jgi:hypothetical protein
MPFKSKKQERAAFGGYLGEKMKKAAPEWARKTDQKNLPESVSKGKSTKAFNKKKAGR